jgi:fumarate hydratase class I
MPSGSFGPTTAGRMDVYVEEFQNMAEAWLCLLKETEQTSYNACKTYGGFT